MVTNDDIIKGLECLAGKNVQCVNCAYYYKYKLSACEQYAAADALKLIFELKAEIERLQKYNETLLTANTALSKEILDNKVGSKDHFSDVKKMVRKEE